MRNLFFIIVFISVFFFMNIAVYAENQSLNNDDSIIDKPILEENDINDVNDSNDAIDDAIDNVIADTPITIADIFSDLTIDHFAYHAIQNLYEANSLHSREADKYLPDSWISRAEFLFMLLNAMGRYPTDEIVPVFNDVDNETAYANYIDVAYRLGIIDGYGNGSFRPGDPVNRDAMLKMIITSTGQLKYDINFAFTWQERQSLLSPFSDRNTISSWAEHYIVYALANNMITGYPDGTIKPTRYTTRAEAAVLIDRFILSKDNSVNADDVLTLDTNDTTIKYLTEMHMRSTAYNSNQPGLGNYTRSGLHTRIGTVAVDPNVIPLGTHLYIVDYGYAIAADTGGAIKGDIVDLYVATVQEARAYGRQHVTVYVLP